MLPRRYVCCLLLVLLAGLLPGGRARAWAQVDTLPTRFYWRPYTRQYVDSASQRQVRLRYWLLRYTERRYTDLGQGRFRLSSKDRVAWFFGRVTRQVSYVYTDTGRRTRSRVRHYRRYRHTNELRPRGKTKSEYLTAMRDFDRGKLRTAARYRDGYYRIRQPPDWWFSRREYRKMR